jgi:arylsulfatase A-like enzyme
LNKINNNNYNILVRYFSGIKIYTTLLGIGPLSMFSQCREASVADEKPNIIIILADDLGYGDLDCYGNNMNDTPNLDKMARGGLLFTDFHSNGAVCSPTRAALLSGKYQQRVGIQEVVHATKFRHTGITPGTYTIASYAKSQGYCTGIIGKWHLGYDTAFSPLNYGFDYFKGYVSGNVDYHSHIDGAGIYDWWEQKDTIIEPGYSTDLITLNAVKFIQDHRQEPFLLYVAHESPHAPYQGRNDSPMRKIGGLNTEHSPSDQQKTYREMIAIMDEGIGSIFSMLEQLNLCENTFVFFFSDNGANNAGSNVPFRGYKSSLWEGGHRVPAIASWKGRIEPGTSNELLLGIDIFPTIAALIGKKPPVGTDLDGIDFSPVLFDRESLAERPVFWRTGEEKSIRKGSWKLLVLKDSTYLFNLSDDPSEQMNILHEKIRITDNLQHLLKEWEAEMNTYIINTY